MVKAWSWIDRGRRRSSEELVFDGLVVLEVLGRGVGEAFSDGFGFAGCCADVQGLFEGVQVAGFARWKSSHRPKMAKLPELWRPRIELRFDIEVRFGLTRAAGRGLLEAFELRFDLASR